MHVSDGLKMLRHDVAPNHRPSASRSTFYPKHLDIYNSEEGDVVAMTCTELWVIKYLSVSLPTAIS